MMSNNTQHTLQILLTLICLVITLPSFAQVTSSVDRQLISDEETFHLIIEAKGDDRDHDPDLSPLRENFDILGSSQSSRMQIINGRTDASKQWQITLAPKRTGSLTLPAIPVGNKRTQAISIKVISAAQTQQQTGKLRPIIVEASVDKTSPYVQEQVILTIRLYHIAQLRSASMSEPELNNAVIEKIGEDKPSREQKDGQLYDVIERRYAIFPQQSGSLDIPPIRFEGAVVETRRNNANRGFFNDPFDMLQPTKTIRTQTKVITLNVKTIPTDFQGQHWLPAKALQLQEQWSPDSTQFEIGEPITRTIVIAAQGVISSQLPNLDVPSLKEINIYPDQTAQENRHNENGVLGLMQQKLALLPNASGEVTLPEISIPWWNTQTQRNEVATLPAKTITLVASTETSSSTPDISTENEQQQLSQDPSNNLPTRTITNNAKPYWTWLTFIFGGLWFITLYFWWRERSKSQHTSLKPKTTDTKQINAKQLMQQLTTHCEQNNAQKTRDTLITWAQFYWPTQTIRTLADIQNQCGDDRLIEEIKELNHSLYTSTAEAWNGKSLLNALKDFKIKPVKSNAASATPNNLPQLYET